MVRLKLAGTNIDRSISELVAKSDHKTLAIWGADCAERVLTFFEKKYPKDNRPRNAIEAGRAWTRGELRMTEARKAAFAAHAAARDANEFAEACSAARAAGHAASTAHTARHAVYAAIYAATALREASGSPDAMVKEREWQYQHLVGIGEGVKIS